MDRIPIKDKTLRNKALEALGKPTPDDSEEHAIEEIINEEILEKR